MISNFTIVLDYFLNNLIPESKLAVNKGNKIFGAFIIRKTDMSLTSIGTNNEIENPIFHGEISAILNFFNKNHKNLKDYYFISSHQPCSLCLSAITWSGFDNFYYFFPYNDTKLTFNIPHDLNIMTQIFNIDNGNYSKNNDYWTSYSIIEEINNLKKYDELSIKIDKIRKEYQDLSKYYQESKYNNKIPLN